MAMQNPVGRVNYEPNSRGATGGPRENPEAGFVSHPAVESGEKVRQRSESFADHFSQARQFFHSQTEIEQQHIVDALVFELSKVESEAIRHRMLSRLQPIDLALAEKVASGMGVAQLPVSFHPPVAARDDLANSPALSILRNPPGTFRGRKVGALVGNGADASSLRALERAVKKAGASIKYISTHKEGVLDSDGGVIDVAEIVNGGPSVLFDSIAVIIPEAELETLAAEPSARQFVADAINHKKYVLYNSSAMGLFAKAGFPDADQLAGMIRMDKAKAAKKFVDECTKLRCWER